MLGQAQRTGAGGLTTESDVAEVVWRTANERLDSSAFQPVPTRGDGSVEIDAGWRRKERPLGAQAGGESASMVEPFR